MRVLGVAGMAGLAIVGGSGGVFQLPRGGVEGREGCHGMGVLLRAGILWDDIEVMDRKYSSQRRQECRMYSAN